MSNLNDATEIIYYRVNNVQILKVIVNFGCASEPVLTLTLVRTADPLGPGRSPHARSVTGKSPVEFQKSRSRRVFSLIEAWFNLSLSCSVALTD